MEGPEEKRESRLKAVLRAVFVHNIGYKVLALGVSALLWLLVVGF